jgi:hypothetical protein
MRQAYFNHFIIEFADDDASSASHQGQCYADVTALLRAPYMAAQFDTIAPDDIRSELKEYGAWDADELADDDQNRARILWIAAGNVMEETVTHEESEEAMCSCFPIRKHEHSDTCAWVVA